MIVVDGNVEPFAKMVAVMFFLKILMNGGDIYDGPDWTDIVMVALVSLCFHS